MGCVYLCVLCDVRVGGWWDDMWVVLIAASITETHAPDASLRGEDGTELRIKAGEISKEREMRFVKDFSVLSVTRKQPVIH